MYCTYVDWTCEEVPRPFYVGKGTLHRAAHKKRNKHHTNIAEKYGIRREIVLVTSVEELAYDYEIFLISEYKTYVYSGEYYFGANYTPGGGRNKGFHHSEFSKEKLSIATSGKNNPMYGKKHSLEKRKQMSESHKGKVCSEKHRANMRKAHLGKKSPRKGAKMTLEQREAYKLKRQQRKMERKNEIPSV